MFDGATRAARIALGDRRNRLNRAQFASVRIEMERGNAGLPFIRHEEVRRARMENEVARRLAGGVGYDLPSSVRELGLNG